MNQLQRNLPLILLLGGNMGETFDNLVSIMTKSFRVDSRSIEELRQILSEQNNQDISFDEAEQIGRSLITVYETLANGRIITVSNGNSDGQ